MIKICYIPPKRDLRTSVDLTCKEFSTLNLTPSQKKKVIPLFSAAGTYLLCANDLLAATAKADNGTVTEQVLNPLKTLGDQFIDVVQFMGFYLAIGMCLFEIIKAFLESDPKKIPAILVRYSIAVASLYTVPLVFNVIREAFTEALKATRQN